MPYTVKKRKGSRPWKIFKGKKIVGSSKTKKKAEASKRIREAYRK